MASGRNSTFRLKTSKHKAIKVDDVIAFFQQLSTLLVAGTPLLHSLQVAGQQSESEKFTPILKQVAARVASGNNLCAAFTEHPKIFEETWVEMIKAGESSGRLAETLTELTIYIKTRKEIRSKVVSAMIYPAIMIVVLIASLIIMLGKVVPTFAEFLADFGQELPGITQVVIAMSDFVQEKFMYLIIVPAVVGFSLLRYFRTPNGRRQRDTLMIQMPLMGQLIVESVMERFAHNLALLLKSGTPLLEALRILAQIFKGQGVYHPALVAIYGNVSRGEGLSVAMERSGMFTPMVVNMVNIGEESGTLQEVLEEIATFYRGRVELLVSRVLGMMEPIIVIFMGASVGTILMSIYLPMFQMAGGPG